MRPKAHAGFTLIELVVAMALLGAMMVLLYSGLSFALRGWDAGDANGRRTADRRLGENFLRRELRELFPMRWKDPMEVKFAFQGEASRLRFVSSRAAGVSLGGVSLVGVEVEADAATGSHHLVMRRAMPDDDAKDFSPLDRAERSILIADVESVSFAYFGGESDFAEPRWFDGWTFPYRLPQLVRIRVKTAQGTVLPDLVVKLMLGEEAGCLESVYQRQCRPRRPA
ncbi:MAG TPA: prepilin-type N-terminal cleavage/methylation domain-containing protein [Usitatibacter sp.]|nr:prepilin-type N-terminal cleavage/methylation domain-containing protein [Usitatibacter sp.]